MAFDLGDILVRFKADTTDLKKGVGDVQDMGQQTKTLGEKIQTGMNVAAAGLAVVGAGLSLYAKNATDFTVDFVKSSKALGVQLGVSTTEASRLSAAMQRMGIDAESSQQMFGLFAKQISKATNETQADKIAQQDLSLQIRKTQADISATSAEIAKNGDHSGALTLKLDTLKNKLAGLQDQMQQSGSAFTQLGISMTNSDGTAKGFNQILNETADKFKAMPDGVEKTTLAMELFGRSGKDMIKVLNLGSDGIADLEKQADALGLTLNENTIGRVNELVQAQKDLKQQTDALKIAVGTAAAPILTSFNKAINDIIGGLLNAPGPIHDVTVGFLAFGGAAASGAAALFGFLANAADALPLLGKMASALKITTAAQWLLNVAMSANPVVLIILAIIALIGILVYLYFHFEGVRKVVDAVFSFVWKIIQDVYHWVRDHWPLLLAIFLGPFGMLITYVIKHFNAIKDTIMAVMSFIYNNIIKPYVDLMTAVWKVLWGVIDFIYQTIVAVTNAVYSAIWAVVKPILDMIIAYYKFMFELIMAGWNLVAGVIMQVWNFIWANVIQPYLNIITAAMQGTWNFIVSIWQGAVGFFQSIWDAIRAPAESVANAIGSFFSGVWEGIKGGFKSAANFVIDQANKLINAYNRTIGKIPNTPHIANVDRFARGTENFAGGGAVVGEEGSELALFPSGTKVVPHNLTANLVDNLMNVGGMLRSFLSNGMGNFLSSAQLAPSGAAARGSVHIETNINGDINIGSQQDADYFFSRLDRNSELEEMGFSVVTGKGAK